MLLEFYFIYFSIYSVYLFLVFSCIPSYIIYKYPMYCVLLEQYNGVVLSSIHLIPSIWHGTRVNSSSLPICCTVTVRCQYVDIIQPKFKPPHWPTSTVQVFQLSFIVTLPFSCLNHLIENFFLLKCFNDNLLARFCHQNHHQSSFQSWSSCSTNRTA